MWVFFFLENRDVIYNVIRKYDRDSLYVKTMNFNFYMVDLKKKKNWG